MADTATPAPPQIPFQIASRVNERLGFQLNAALGVAPVTPAGVPLQLPAVGYPKNLHMEFTLTATGGTPTFAGDAPFNLIQNISLKNSAGQQMLSAMNGYSLAMINKYGAITGGLADPSGQATDPRFGSQYSAVAATGAHFFLDVPFEIDASTGLGAIPALAANRSYVLEITFSPIVGVWTATTPPTAVTVTVDTSIVYWDAPSATTPKGVTQGIYPFGVDITQDLTTTSLWQSEFPTMGPGQQLMRSNNVGNVIRSHIFILRNSSGVRVDADWPSLFSLYVNNYPQLRLKKNEWKDYIIRWFQLAASSADVAGGLDTGVFVIPYFVLAGGTPGDVTASRAQLLPTEDATLLQFYADSFGAAASQFQVLTQAIACPDPRYIYSK